MTTTRVDKDCVHEAYLTRHVYDILENESSSSKRCCGHQLRDSLFYVYTSDSNLLDVKQYLIDLVPKLREISVLRSKLL